MKNEFQYRLQKALADRQISAAELSRLSGVGKSDISNYINGVYIAKQEKCYLLAKALNVDPNWLMTGEEPRSADRPLVELPPQDSISDNLALTLILSYSVAEEWQQRAVREILKIPEDLE